MIKLAAKCTILRKEGLRDLYNSPDIVVYSNRRLYNGLGMWLEREEMKLRTENDETSCKTLNQMGG
jgi:hypothetical protein